MTDDIDNLTASLLQDLYSSRNIYSILSMMLSKTALPGLDCNSYITLIEGLSKMSVPAVIARCQQ